MDLSKIELQCPGTQSDNSQDSIIRSNDHGNDSDKGMSGTIHLYNPTSTTINTNANAHMVIWHKDNFTQMKNIGGFRLGATDDAFVKFFFNSGNIASGTISLYGLTNG